MIVKTSTYKKNAVILFLLFLLLSLGIYMKSEATASAQDFTYLSKTGSALDLLVALDKRNALGSLPAEAARAAAGIEQTRTVRVSIRFEDELDHGEIAELESLGVIFVRLNGTVAHSGTIYGAQIPVDILDELKNRMDILRIESVWQPGEHSTLDVSVPEINADDVWRMRDSGGQYITGEGIIVANFDTGIDVFHPDFWNADGPTYNWIDTNSNSTFDPGIDVVDLNGNTGADGNETLDFFDAAGPAGNNDSVFQVDMDWLYNDANNNAQRDYGTGLGYTEAHPTYGELIFIADDTNSNNALDVGESLIALGTNKVLGTLNSNGIERERGTDLIFTAADANGHGTSVCGIISGGIIGRRKYVGVSPKAELLVADRYGNDFTVYIPWARTNGADVMLYEFGGWVQQFLDGSSNIEQAIDTEAAGGIVQVVPAGNLGGSNKHAQHDVASNGGTTNFTLNIPSTDNPGTPGNEDIDWVYISALWRTPGNNLAFTVITPTPIVANLPATPGDTQWYLIVRDGHNIWYRREDSTRGTAKYDIAINRNKVTTGGWTVQVNNPHPNNDEHVDMYMSDNRSSWSGGAVWTAFQSEDNTITRPATADSAIAVASYSTRGTVVVAGEISTFNPTGPRIDGRAIMDIAAPGNYDIAAAYSKDSAGGSLGAYDWFGGTSAAGPHVAAASALLLQWNVSLNHDQIKAMLQQYARTDAFTGVTPNSEWGYGKLDVLAIVIQQLNIPPVYLLLLFTAP